MSIGFCNHIEKWVNSKGSFRIERAWVSYTYCTSFCVLPRKARLQNASNCIFRHKLRVKQNSVKYDYTPVEKKLNWYTSRDSYNLDPLWGIRKIEKKESNKLKSLILEEAKALIERRPREYNQVCPHGAKHDRTLAQESVMTATLTQEVVQLLGADHPSFVVSFSYYGV